VFFFFSSRRRHTRFSRDWSSDVCSSDLNNTRALVPEALAEEITETAARAADDLKERQRAQIDALGLPLSMDQVDGLPEATKAYGRKTLGQAAYLRQQHDEAIRRLRQQ